MKMEKEFAEGIRNEKLLKWGGKCTLFIVYGILLVQHFLCARCMYNVLNCT